MSKACKLVAIWESHLIRRTLDMKLPPTFSGNTVQRQPWRGISDQQPPKPRHDSVWSKISVVDPLPRCVRAGVGTCVDARLRELLGGCVVCGWLSGSGLGWKSGYGCKTWGGLTLCHLVGNDARPRI